MVIQLKCLNLKSKYYLFAMLLLVAGNSGCATVSDFGLLDMIKKEPGVARAEAIPDQQEKTFLNKAAPASLDVTAKTSLEDSENPAEAVAVKVLPEVGDKHLPTADADKIQELDLAAVLAQSKAASPEVMEKAPMVSMRFPWSKSDELIGQSILYHEVKEGETLMELARLYGVGFNEISLAHPQVDPWKPKVGSILNFSTERILPAIDNPADIIVNVPEMRLYHRKKNGTVDTYPVGVGRVGFSTPKGDGILIRKKSKPAWYVPKSILEEKPELEAIVLPGPDNPLGSHALYLSIEGYLLHGTNKPLGIGRRVSHGCIRLYPEDVVDFYKQAKIGSNVRLVYESVKVGWRFDRLYMEVFPLFDEEKAEDPKMQLRMMATKAINQALKRRPGLVVQIDWGVIDDLLKQPDGVPHPVAQVMFGKELSEEQ